MGSYLVLRWRTKTISQFGIAGRELQAFQKGQQVIIRSFQTCRRRFQQWLRSGVMTRIMPALAHKLSTRGAIDVRDRGHKFGKTKRGKGTKIMAVADSNGLPVSV